VDALAAALPLGVRDPGFEVLLRRIDRGPVHRGNRVEVFACGPAAFDAMRHGIESASEEVLVESYILRDDEMGRGFLDSLKRARGRGARVRVLADAFGSFDTHIAFWQAMEAAGMEVHLYHKLFPYIWAQAFRDHRKIIVIDRRVAFVGGMNIANEYGSSRASRGGPWRDTHARVEGPAAWELAVVFGEGWKRAGGTPLDLPPLEALDGHGPRALVLDSRPGRGHSESASVLSAIVGAARRRVRITNSYFAPGWTAIEVLARAAARGVEVTLLLPGKSDVSVIRHAGHGYFATLLAHGVHVFEYQPAVLHAKTLVADGYVSVIGSTNMDFRSFRFNAECNVVVLDEEVGATMDGIYEQDLERSVEIEAGAWSRRRWLHRLGDEGARLLSPAL
jgi:cardiolipin synthase